MTLFLEQFKQAYTGYFEKGFFAFLILVVVAISLVTLKAKKRKEVFIYLPTVIILITIMNPIYCMLVNETADYAYARSYWYIPFFFILAFLLSMLIKKINNRVRRKVVCVVIIACIMIWGSTVFSNTTYPFTLEQNIYRMPNDLVEICDYISKDNHNEPVVMAPKDINRYIRVYNSNIKNFINSWNCEVYSDDAVVQNERLKINEQINIENPDVDYLMDFAMSVGCDYVVFSKKQKIGDSMEVYGECVKETDNYRIYRLL